MKREIKFRAWDENKQKMFYNFWIDSRYQSIKFFDKKDQPFVVDVEIMQFTGLKDKNGTDIFEGDLVNCWLEKGFNEADDIFTGEVVFDETRAAYFCKRKDSYQLMLNNFFKFEVIGNIWEK